MPFWRTISCIALLVVAAYFMWKREWGAATCMLLLLLSAELMTIREALTRTTTINLR